MDMTVILAAERKAQRTQYVTQYTKHLAYLLVEACKEWTHELDPTFKFQYQFTAQTMLDMIPLDHDFFKKFNLFEKLYGKVDVDQLDTYVVQLVPWKYSVMQLMMPMYRL